MFAIENHHSEYNDKFAYKNLIAYQRRSCLEIGDYKLSARISDKNGWLICDGRSVAITNYPELYDVIGTSFGSEDDGYFNLPDYRGRVIGGFGQGDGLTNRNIGDYIGAETHQLTVSELPSHNHTGTTASDGDHSHTVANVPYGTQSVDGGGLTACDETTSTVTTSTAGAHTHTFTSNNTGSNTPHNNMQPTLFGCNVLIFAKFVGRFELDPMYA
jgi:microcystin-dependent protein